MRYTVFVQLMETDESDGGTMENGYQNYGQNETSGQGTGEEEHSCGYTGNPFENMEYGLCKRCGRRNIDRSENPDSILCRDCREELIKLRVPPFFYVIGAAVLLLVVFTFVTSMGGFRNFGSYNSAEDLAKDGYVCTALDNLLNILEENPDNKETAIKLTDLGMEYAYYDYAAYAISNYLSGKEVSDYQYDKINGYIRKLDDYYATYDLYSEIAEEVFADVEDTEDAESLLDEFNRRMSEYIGTAGYDQALLYYYLGYMSADEEARIAYFTECIGLNPHYYDAQAQIATYYRRRGELDRARKQLEEVYRLNKEDYSVLRSYATLELVEGNLEKGLDYAAQAYRINPEGEYVIDTYIIALAANGSNEEAEAMKDVYMDAYEFDEDLYRFLRGEMTLEEYYIGE